MQLDAEDSAASLHFQSLSSVEPLSAPATNSQHAALEEFSLFLKKMRAVQHRSQHYSLPAATAAEAASHATTVSVDSARPQQQAEA